MKRLTISMPNNTHSILRRLAEKDGRSVSNYAASLLEEYLKQQPNYEEEVMKMEEEIRDAKNQKMKEIDIDGLGKEIERRQVEELREIAKKNQVNNYSKLDKAQLTFELGKLGADIPTNLLMSKEEYIIKNLRV